MIHSYHFMETVNAIKSIPICSSFSDIEEYLNLCDEMIKTKLSAFLFALHCFMTLQKSILIFSKVSIFFIVKFFSIRNLRYDHTSLIFFHEEITIRKYRSYHYITMNDSQFSSKIPGGNDELKGACDFVEDMIHKSVFTPQSFAGVSVGCS